MAGTTKDKRDDENGIEWKAIWILKKDIVKIPSENHNSIFVHLYLHTGALAFVVVYLKKHKQLWWMSFGMRM